MTVIATASWSVPKAFAGDFPSEGTVLERYAAVFRGVEINSTFYKSHRSITYERWANSVDADFRFAVKIPKRITHEKRLSDIGQIFRDFIAEIAPLGQKLGPLLCQLPPSLGFESQIVGRAFSDMRQHYSGELVIEPRHKSWAGEDALALIEEFGIGRVLADPAPVWAPESFEAPVPYLRLHGSPRLYYSNYAADALRRYAAYLGRKSWCVFDNTAEGAATGNALQMMRLLAENN